MNMSKNEKPKNDNHKALSRAKNQIKLLRNTICRQSIELKKAQKEIKCLEEDYKHLEEECKRLEEERERLEEERKRLKKDNEHFKKENEKLKEELQSIVFCAVEPKRGFYMNKVTERRIGPDFAKFLSSVERHYSDSKKIVLVMDNLNTHRKKSLTDFYGKDRGLHLWSRFEVHYTPSHGSWLNQAEIAINMYSRQCLGKSRIPDIETLRKRTKAWVNIMNRRKIIIKWNFSRKSAREKFHYKK